MYRIRVQQNVVTLDEGHRWNYLEILHDRVIVQCCGNNEGQDIVPFAGLMEEKIHCST